MPRITWEQLPQRTRRAVADRVGTVEVVRPVADGLTCRMAAVLATPEGRVFVKGVPLDDARGCAAQRMEATVNRTVSKVGVGPELRWHVTAGGWDLLGFDHIEGHHADLSATSADLAAVADVLDAGQELRAPEGRVPSFADRFVDVLDDDELALLQGEVLLHTDTNPHNLLVTTDRAQVVDWAMPAAGPAWVDVAYAAVRLMEADCTAVEALEWAGRFESWKAADPRAVGAFVAGTCRSWARRVGDRDARSSNARFAALGGQGSPVHA